jgi:hypothetical protein
MDLKTLVFHVIVAMIYSSWFTIHSFENRISINVLCFSYLLKCGGFLNIAKLITFNMGN